MPLVRILLTSPFDEVIRRSGRMAGFCSGVRNAVSEVFHIQPRFIGVVLEHYAPGCEDERPAVTVHVSIGEKAYAAQRDDIDKVLAKAVKAHADTFAEHGVDAAKAVVDFLCRKVVTISNEDPKAT